MAKYNTGANYNMGENYNKIEKDKIIDFIKNKNKKTFTVRITKDKGYEVETETYLDVELNINGNYLELKNIDRINLDEVFIEIDKSFLKIKRKKDIDNADKISIE